MRKVHLILALALISSISLAQTRQRATVSNGEKTVVGCVAMDAGGYALKTADGRSIPLRGGRDLSGYVGKQVQIHATWEETGVTMAAPSDNVASAAGGGEAAGTAPDTKQAFAGDIHLKLKGQVIGDCLGKKK